MAGNRRLTILDVMGPVMVGPSSSHTAGTARLGRVSREVLGLVPDALRFHLHPPLEKTYRGHGSDFALVGGAIGMSVDDPRIPEAIRIAEQSGVEIDFQEEDLGDVHPNTVRIEAASGSRTVEIIGSSIGGAAIEVFRINGFPSRYSGDSPTLLMFYRDRLAMIHQVTGILAEEGINIASLECSRKERGREAFMQIDLDSPLSSGAIATIRGLEDVREAIFIDRIA
ncbi:MAG: L-serine ammonia-lyase, iron-sulfur-dependent subunit beta [Acidobacteria bacterium]|nr:L-serine ammonia-lyase, iron-sulfur-dependent subunit beta [Acidobacteriota bacterium]